jgi:DNA-directed RNA polymerase specialized sigma24 family protein
LASRNGSPGTDPEFLRRLKQGDESAWEELLERWEQPLYRFLCYSLGNADYAADVLSETLVALVTAIQNFDGQVAISTFIYRIAANKKADFWRRRRPTQQLPFDLMVDGPSDLGMELQEALDSLPEIYREALLLRYYFGFGVDEIAVIIGRTYKATESVLSRGRRQLRQILESASV